MKKTIFFTIVILILASCGLVRHNVNGFDRNLPDQVVIRRTDYGIPHIYADNMKAAGFALGFVQMEDHGERVASVLLRARGEWSKYNELTGPALERAIDSDAGSRRNYRRAVETWPLLEEDTRQFLDGFAAGVNLYIAKNRREFDDWAKPFFTGMDVHARNIGSPDNGSVRRFLDAESKRRGVTNNEDTVAVIEGFSLAFAGIDEEIVNAEDGSNAWAFNPSRTSSGKAILLRNPHLSWDAGYYEAHIIVPGKFNFYGDFRIGYALGIIGGFNSRLGWATTNNAPDLDEVYSFDVDPANEENYLLDGVSVPLNFDTVTVEYGLRNGFGTATRDFASTPYGPVILRNDKKVYIIRSAGDGEYRSGEQFLKMMKARNFDEWTAAMKIRAKTNSNLTYADADGNIYYVWNASIPDLPHEGGGDTCAIHVVRTDQMWHKYVEWEKLPQLKNPEGGYVRNENDPFHFTNLNEVLSPEEFPSWFPRPQLRLRSQHSLELIHNDRILSLEDVVELKHSMRMILADRVKEDLIKAVAGMNYSGEVAEALSMISAWDGTVAADSRGGLLFEVWWNRYVATADTADVRGTPASAGFPADPGKLFREPWSYDNPAATPYGLADYTRATEAFVWAVDEARRRFGDWNLPWGEVHRAVMGNVDVAVGGGSGLLGCFRVLNFTRHNSDENKRQVSGGDGWILAVEFDDIPRAYSVLAYGQSIKPDSPFNSDQVAVFADNRMTPVAYTDEDINKNLIKEYRPGRRR